MFCVVLGHWSCFYGTLHGKSPVQVWFMYIARCSDDTLYIGVARDVAARIASHNAGRGARYTRGRGPLQVLAKRKCATQGEALRLESALKRLRRAEKIAVATSPRKLRAFSLRIAAI